MTTLMGTEKDDTKAAADQQAQQQAAERQAYKFGGKEYASVDELGKAYEAAQSELGKWTQQYGDVKKQYDDVSARANKWDEWWKTVQPLWGDDVEAVLRRKLAGDQGGVQQQQRPTQAQAAQAAQQAAQQQAAQQAQEMYDFYKPEDVARFKQSVAGELARYFNGQLGTIVQAMNQTLAQKEQWYQTYLTNHLSLLRRALEQKLKNPGFDVDSVMENAARAIGGQIDPIELGQKLLAAETVAAQLEEAKKASYAQGKKDYEQEIANKKQEAPPPMFSVPKFTLPTTPPGTRNGLHTLRERAAERLAKQFGPQVFLGE